MNKEYYIVTGANGSIGQAITEAIAQQGLPTIMACRNIAKAEPIRQRIASQTGNNDVRLIRLDLASMDSIATFTQLLTQEGIVIKALINNAGIMCKEFGQTTDGYEQTIGINYLGTVALTEQLIPLMRPGSRIVMTTSLTRYIGKINETFFADTPENYARFKAYSKSKLALTIYTARLAEELRDKGITVNASDPGIVDTDMITMHSAWIDPIANALFRPFISSPQSGAIGAIYSATAQYVKDVSGEIFSQKRHSPIPAKLLQSEQAQWLLKQTSLKIRTFQEVRKNQGNATV